MVNNSRTTSDNIRVIKNMTEFLGNPQTCKELSEALTKMKADDIFDLHDEEKHEAYTLNSRLYHQYTDQQYDENMAQKEYFFKNTELLRHKYKIEELVRNLWNYYKMGNVGGMWTFEELEEKNDKYKEDLKDLYRKAIIGLLSYSKKITTEDLRHIERKICERFREVNWLEASTVSQLYTLLEKYIRSDSDIGKALLEVGEMHGEDISRPIRTKYGEDNTLTEKKIWPSVTIGFYCLGHIDYIQWKVFLLNYKDSVKDDIMRMLQSSLPTINRMSQLLSKVQDNPVQGLIKQADPSNELLKGDIKIDVSRIQEAERKRNALHTIAQTEDTVVQAALDKLKSIMNLEGGNELPENFQKIIDKPSK